MRMKLLALPLLAVPALLSGAAQDHEVVELDLEGARRLEQRIQEVYEQVAPTVVGIRILSGFGTQVGEGSGVIVSEDGLVLTVGHNIPQGAGQETALVLADGREVRGRTLGSNTAWDYGLIQIEEPGPYPFAEMAPDDTLERREVVLTIGHPNGMRAGRPPVLRVGSTSRAGASTQRWVQPSQRDVAWIRHTGKIMPGDSGGGVFDLDGRVVGVNAWINENPLQNFASSMAQLREDFPGLLAGKELGRRSSSRGPLWEFGLRVRSIRRSDSVQIVAVVEDSPAEAIGFEAGDFLDTFQLGDGEVLDLESRRRMDGYLTEAWELKSPEERTITIQGRRPRRARAERPLEFTFQLEEPDPEAALEPVELPKPGLTFESEGPHVLNADVNVSMKRAMIALTAPLDSSVFEVRERNDDDPRTLAVAIEDDLFVTVASELRGRVEIRRRGGSWVEAKRLAVDESTDLLLLAAELEGDVALEFTVQDDLVPGRVLAAAGTAGRALEAGVIGAPGQRITRQPNGFLGVETRDANPEGAVITRIVSGTAAAASDLRRGDVILAVNGEATRGSNGLVGQLRRREVDELVAFRIGRQDEVFEVDIRIGQRPGSDSSGRMRHVANRTNTNRRKTDYAHAVRHDLNLDPHGAGAPLVDLDGAVIGLHVTRADRPGGYLIPSTNVLAAVHRMKASLESSGPK